MPDKPRAIFMARVEISLFCECGGGLERLPGGAYVCRPAAPMYEKGKA